MTVRLKAVLYCDHVGKYDSACAAFLPTHEEGEDSARWQGRAHLWGKKEIDGVMKDYCSAHSGRLAELRQPVYRHRTPTKEYKALVGKKVTLLRKLTTQGGEQFQKGLLMKVTGYYRGKFDLSACHEKGHWIRSVDRMSFAVYEKPEGATDEEE